MQHLTPQDDACTSPCLIARSYIGWLSSCCWEPSLERKFLDRNRPEPDTRAVAVAAVIFHILIDQISLKVVGSRCAEADVAYHNPCLTELQRGSQSPAPGVIPVAGVAGRRHGLRKIGEAECGRLSDSWVARGQGSSYLLTLGMNARLIWRSGSTRYRTEALSLILPEPSTRSRAWYWIVCQPVPRLSGIGLVDEAC